MKQIYDLNLWGGSSFDFYSGEGSHNPNITVPYLESVIAFLKSLDEPLSVCDLGCGDFNIGQYLVKYTKKYIGVDIVENLIERNKKLFKADVIGGISKPHDCVVQLGMELFQLRPGCTAYHQTL